MDLQGRGQGGCRFTPSRLHTNPSDEHQILGQDGVGRRREKGRALPEMQEHEERMDEGYLWWRRERQWRRRQGGGGGGLPVHHFALSHRFLFSEEEKEKGARRGTRGAG
jgi:hypothetical protein